MARHLTLLTHILELTISNLESFALRFSEFYAPSVETVLFKTLK